jgi:hypothetical protein
LSLIFLCNLDLTNATKDNGTKNTLCSFQGWLGALPGYMQPCIAGEWYNGNLGLDKCGGEQAKNSSERHDTQCISSKWYRGGPTNVRRNKTKVDCRVRICPQDGSDDKVGYDIWFTDVIENC